MYQDQCCTESDLPCVRLFTYDVRVLPFTYSNVKLLDIYFWCSFLKCTKYVNL